MSDKIRSLAQAIRVGSLSTKQCRLVYFEHLEDGSLAACVLGTAALAVGFNNSTDESIIDILFRRFPELFDRRETPPLLCPQCATRAGNTLKCMIQHLNDNHHWSREAIADYVEEVQKDTI